MQLHKRRSFGARKVSPPQPTCMTDEQKATYLAGLRNNRPARPTGSRPLPSKLQVSGDQDEGYVHLAESALSQRYGAPMEDETAKRHPIPTAATLTSRPSMGSVQGRPLVSAPTGSRKVSPSSISYRPSTAREQEKQEARSLREALETIDFADEESRIHAAAQTEAAELVWRHLNPQAAEDEIAAPYRNPDLAKKRYVIQQESSTFDQNRRSDSHRNFSGGSQNVQDSTVEEIRPLKRGSRQLMAGGAPEILYSNRRRSSGKRNVSTGSNKGVFRNPDDHIYEEPEDGEVTAIDVDHDRPLRSRTRNSLLRGFRPSTDKAGDVRPLVVRAHAVQEPQRNLPNISHVDCPSLASAEQHEDHNGRPDPQLGRAMEIRSEEIRAATSFRRKDRSPKLPTPTVVSDKLGRPIVSFDPNWKPNSQRSDIDQKRPSARSRAAVPERQSIPIIPTINLPDEEHSVTQKVHHRNSVPHISLQAADRTEQWAARNSKQNIPEINLPDDDEPVTLSQTTPGPPIPSISFPDEQTDRPNGSLVSTNLSAQPAQRSAFPPRQHREATRQSQSSSPDVPMMSAGQPRQSAVNRLPWFSRAPATTSSHSVFCSACTLPISGRIVTATGANEIQKARFHPECFTCHHCSTPLECVSFYPEPESSRLQRQTEGGVASSEDYPHQKSASPEEGILDLRFYCHLDYHELFSPRCANCKTPIEGAVILAAGKAWHEGHFFCGECGDPFDSTSPFVEHQGYAYCVKCHTKRTSVRCRACRNLILDEVAIEALGGKWHEECFVCDGCGEDFGDEGKFFVRLVEATLTEKEKRKAAATAGSGMKKMEERAVCERCEAQRLKEWEIDAFL